VFGPARTFLLILAQARMQIVVAFCAVARHMAC
jgi:hypothetical protein